MSLGRMGRMGIAWDGEGEDILMLVWLDGMVAVLWILTGFCCYW